MKKILVIVIVSIFFMACKQSTQNSTSINTKQNIWQHQLDSLLPLLGHRNWIIIVDKAFPALTSNMEVINIDDSLLPVLQYTLQQIDTSTHVTPITYQDKELNFLTENEAPGIEAYKASLNKLFKGQPATAILHDSVFAKMDAASRLFKVLVLKTATTIPYSSIYLQLNCKYWNAEKEQLLRNRMKTANTPR